MEDIGNLSEESHKLAGLVEPAKGEMVVANHAMKRAYNIQQVFKTKLESLYESHFKQKTQHSMEWVEKILMYDA